MNKIALVTGGSRGLGRDMAIAIAKKNIDVVLTYVSNPEGAAETVAEIVKLGRKAIAIKLDMENLTSYDQFVADFKAILLQNWGATNFDFLVQNAGIGSSTPIAEVTEELFDKLNNIHFKGVYFLTQKLLPIINNNGSVVFISSGSTRFCVNGYSVYSSLKAAIETFSKFVAKEYGARGIRSNVVAPGPIETDFNGAAIRNNPRMKAYLAGASALGRVGAADDIGSVVAMLCTEDTKWINGQRIEVSGGINL